MSGGHARSLSRVHTVPSPSHAIQCSVPTDGVALCALQVPVIGASRNDANAAWESLEASAAENKTEAARRAETAKRLSFYETQDWVRLQALLADSGMIERGDGKDAKAVTICPERTMAMLALTAFRTCAPRQMPPACTLAVCCSLPSRPPPVRFAHGFTARPRCTCAQTTS
jgi:hypothetical protein